MKSQVIHFKEPLLHITGAAEPVVIGLDGLGYVLYSVTKPAPIFGFNQAGWALRVEKMLDWVDLKKGSNQKCT